VHVKRQCRIQSFAECAPGMLNIRDECNVLVKTGSTCQIPEYNTCRMLHVKCQTTIHVACCMSNAKVQYMLHVACQIREYNILF